MPRLQIPAIKEAFNPQFLQTIGQSLHLNVVFGIVTEKQIVFFWNSQGTPFQDSEKDPMTIRHPHPDSQSAKTSTRCESPKFASKLSPNSALIALSSTCPTREPPSGHQSIAACIWFMPTVCLRLRPEGPLAPCVGLGSLASVRQLTCGCDSGLKGRFPIAQGAALGLRHPQNWVLRTEGPLSIRLEILGPASRAEC